MRHLAGFCMRTTFLRTEPGFFSVAAITFVMRLRYRAYRVAASDLMQRSRMASWLPVPAKAWALNAVNIQ